MIKYLYSFTKGIMCLSFASIFVPNVYYNTKNMYNEFSGMIC